MANSEAFRRRSLDICFRADTLHAFLQMRLQRYNQGYPARYTQGSATSKVVRSSGLQAKLKFWPASEDQAFTSDPALAKVEALASVESSGQQTSQPLSMLT
jgi:hypothetical protein